MGTLYSVFVLDEIANTQDGVDWLQKSGVGLPEHLLPGREPTLREIKRAAESGEAWELEYWTGAESLHITISDKESEAWAALVVMDYDARTEDPDRPYEFFFEAGHIDLVRAIVQALADVCGPFVLTKNGEDPELLLPR